MREDVIKTMIAKETVPNSIDSYHDRLRDLFQNHGIPSRDKNQIQEYCAGKNLSEKLTLLRIAQLFDVLPEWLDPSAKKTELEPLVYMTHIYSSIASWAEKLISDKQQGFQPQIIFVSSKMQPPSVLKPATKNKATRSDGEVLVFTELTKKLKTNMICRVYQHSKLPCWQEALELIEKALLPYRGIMLESGPYQALRQQTILPVVALGTGHYWSLSPGIEVAEWEDSLKQNAFTKEKRALSFYAEKLRYTIPKATPQVADLECPLV